MNKGSILSTRRYSIGGNDNQGNYKRSMVISSGASPMAYILSNFNKPDNWELRLYKFDPLKFTNNPVWVMGASSCSDC